MANIKNGNSTYFVMVKLASFGTMPTALTAGKVFHLGALMKTTVNSIERPVRNIYMLKQVCLYIATTNQSSVQLTGTLTLDALILLQAWFNKAASAYTVGTSSVSDTYTIFLYDSVAGTAQYVAGCSLQNLSIAGTYGQAITFTADFVGKNQSAWTATSSLGLTNIPTNTCDATKVFLMNSSSMAQSTAFGTGSPYLDGFTLNLNTTLVSDNNRFYSNTQPINNNFKTKLAVLTYKTEFDATTDTNVHAQIGVMNTTGSTLTLNTAGKHWAINIKGRLSDYTIDRLLDDPYANNYTLQSAGNGATSGITITVT